MQHCDLTLQFNDNSQLKVHRLVLSACTDYFDHLESVGDNVLIMPTDLQADVVVPIVKFMYTGRLEFKSTLYEPLLKVATDMNLTVLLDALQADRQTSRTSNQPVLYNKFGQRIERPVPSRRTETPWSGPGTAPSLMMVKYNRSGSTGW